MKFRSCEQMPSQVNAPLVIKEVTYASSIELIHNVRYAVFVAEQNVPQDLEFDDQDPMSIHVVAFKNLVPIGTGRLASDGKIGRMAVLKNFRKQGIGRKILLKLIQIGREKGIRKYYLSSQCHAIPFYEKMDFIAEGPTYLEAGINHRLMKRRI